MFLAEDIISVVSDRLKIIRSGLKELNKNPNNPEIHERLEKETKARAEKYEEIHEDFIKLQIMVIY